MELEYVDHFTNNLDKLSDGHATSIPAKRNVKKLLTSVKDMLDRMKSTYVFRERKKPLTEEERREQEFKAKARVVERQLQDLEASVARINNELFPKRPWGLCRDKAGAMVETVKTLRIL